MAHLCLVDVGEAQARCRMVAVSWALLGVATELAERGYGRTLAATAADGVDYLLTIVVKGAKAYPPLQAVRAAPSLLAVFVLLVGRGGLGALR